MSENPVNVNLNEDFLKGAAIGAAGGALLGAVAYSKYKKHSFVYNHGRCPKDGTKLRLVETRKVSKGKNTYIYGIYECEKGHRFKVLLEKHLYKRRPA